MRHAGMTASTQPEPFDGDGTAPPADGPPPTQLQTFGNKAIVGK